MFIDTDRQLRKLSIYKPMNFRIVEIDFDFDDAMTNDDQQEIVDEEWRQPGLPLMVMIWWKKSPVRLVGVLTLLIIVMSCPKKTLSVL